jgi:molybdopterin converting factor small subunit
MKFGDIYQFNYIADTKRGLDKTPRIVFFGETKDKIIGVNLNYLKIESQTGVMTIINQQMLRENPINEDMLHVITQRQKKMDDEWLARILLLANTDDENRNDDEEEEKEEKKLIEIKEDKISKHEAINLMSRAFRVYNKRSIKDLK